MRKSRFSELEILVTLEKTEKGLPVQNLIRTYEISEQPFYRWHEKFGGLEASEVQGHKNVYRFYCEEGLAVRTKKRRIRPVLFAWSNLRGVPQCLKTMAALTWKRVQTSGAGQPLLPPIFIQGTGLLESTQSRLLLHRAESLS